MIYEPIHPPTHPPTHPGPMADGRIDLRADRRHATVLLIGRVRDERGNESACLVHDISAGGLMARFTHVPQVGEALRFTVRGLAEVVAHVVWVDGFKAGVAFDTAQDIAGVLTSRDARGHVPRAPRFAIHATARLQIGDHRIVVTLRDVSAGGVKLATDVPLAAGTAASLQLRMLSEPLFGTICWVRDGQAGFRFCTPLALPRLSLVLA